MNNTELLLQLLINTQIQTNRLLEVIAAQSEYFSEATAQIIVSVIDHDKKALEAATKILNTKVGDNA